MGQKRTSQSLLLLIWRSAFDKQGLGTEKILEELPRWTSEKVLISMNILSSKVSLKDDELSRLYAC